jgi:hypothetical protein
MHAELVHKLFNTSNIANMIIDNNASRGCNYKATTKTSLAQVRHIFREGVFTLSYIECTYRIVAPGQQRP